MLHGVLTQLLPGKAKQQGCRYTHCRMKGTRLLVRLVCALPSNKMLQRSLSNVPSAQPF